MFLELSCGFWGLTFDVLYSDSVVSVVGVGADDVVDSHGSAYFLMMLLMTSMVSLSVLLSAGTRSIDCS